MITLTPDEPKMYRWAEVLNNGETGDYFILPAPGSIVIDNRDLDSVTMEYVISRDIEKMTYESTPLHAHTLAPAVGDDTTESGFPAIDFGNARFYMYFFEEDTAGNGGYKLTVDELATVPGTNVSSYEIMKIDPEGHYIPISMAFDGNGDYVGTKVPVITDGQTGKKIPSHCYTNTPIEQDEMFRIVFYNEAGDQSSEYTLFARKALWVDSSNPVAILDIILEGTQEDSGDFYLFVGQDPSALVVTPKLIIGGGLNKTLTVDGAVTQIFGLSDFTAAFPGQETTVMVKHFLDPYDNVFGPLVQGVDPNRYITTTKRLVVKDIPEIKPCKISVVPRFNASTGKYIMLFYLYTLGSDIVRDITPIVSMDQFDGGEFTSAQEIMLTFDLAIPYDDVDIPQDYNQYLRLKLAPNLTLERYTMQSSPNDTFGHYGVDTPSIPRPRIMVNQSTENSYIPSDLFPDETTFLEAFYYKARPLYESSVNAEPTVPTHFRIRDPASAGLILTGAPIEITGSGFQAEWSHTDADQFKYVGNNLIVEFLEETEPDTFQPLYGVPVDVELGP